jgi:hypothetical protein
MPHLYESMAIANRTPIRWSSWQSLLSASANRRPLPNDQNAIGPCNIASALDNGHHDVDGDQQQDQHHDDADQPPK